MLDKYHYCSSEILQNTKLGIQTHCADAIQRLGEKMQIFFSSSIWIHVHGMLSLLSYAKAPAEIKCFWDLWEPAKLKILMKGIKRRL